MRRAVLLAFCASFLWGAVPTTREHFGFTPGDDYKLAGYTEIIGYFRKLEAGSRRIMLREFGRTSENRPMYAAFISDEENLRRLDHFQNISRELALGRATAAEAARLAREGKAIVWIDSGLHATEVAPAQHAPEFAHRMLTAEDEETRRIRANVILIQIPVINPDGLEIVVDWYRKNVGTPHEVAPLPRLYQKYAGHDNNRDYFMLNLAETRNVSRMLFQEWFPQIVYNQHQTGPFPSRIFVPPYAEPLNPHIPATVMEGINTIGGVIRERMAREGKTGVLSYHGYDAWWNGGLRSVPAFHNMHGILTETAGYPYATPRTYTTAEIPERFSNGIPARVPSIFYERPWMGGRWGLRDAIDYMLTVDFAILELAATRSEHFLRKSYDMARAAIAAGAKGSPYAYVIPKDQWDYSAAVEMLRRMQMSGVEVRRATAAFTAGGKKFAEGSYVIPAAQPFRAYLMDLLEPQRYPEIRTGSGGPVKRPYDMAGWTLNMQMGVQVDRIDEAFDAPLTPSGLLEAQPTSDHRQTASFLHIARELKAGKRVARSSEGNLVAGGGSWKLNPPRVALYSPPMGNMDTGWTAYVLDRYEIPFTELRRDDVKAGALRGKFDTIVLASQRADSIMHGVREGETPSRGNRADPVLTMAFQRPEYSGGIGVAGVESLDRFVREGGTLIALDDATELPLLFFGLPVRPLLRYGADGGNAASEYYSPGSLLRIAVNTSDPVALGMPAEAIAVSTGGQAFDIRIAPEFNKGEREVRTIATYAKENLLASGWISGERPVLGRPILVSARHGKGTVVLFGFRPQFRAQPHGTFKLLLNAIYQASASKASD